MSKETKKIKDWEGFLTERVHTLNDAKLALKTIQNNISKNATLIGGFGKGNITSEHDIDILIPDVEFNEELKNKLIKLLNAESVESTDWGGFYFNKTDYGDVDVFYTTDDFDY